MASQALITDNSLERTSSAQPKTAPEKTLAKMPDDMAMIRAAADLTRDLTAPNAKIYWTDFLASSVMGYGALYAAVTAETLFALVAFAVVAILALYRAGSFIHEVTHIKHAAVPGFRLGWNAIIGIPMLVPSFMYEGVHSLHHARTRYGTAQDPEYLPLALMKKGKLAFFLVVSLLAPVVLILRYAVIAPLSAIVPPLRTLVTERLSALAINPEFTRKPAEGELRRFWIVQETAASIWAITLVVLLITGVIPLYAFAIFMVVASGVAVLNQVRTLVAHLWENEGEVMSQTGQFLDSVNVPPPAYLPALWAPVGLRYHAIHHLLPGLPYHSLGEAHRRLTQHLGLDSTYTQANYNSLSGLLGRLIRGDTKGK
jgi:fatty acid desaturase